MGIFWGLEGFSLRGTGLDAPCAAVADTMGHDRAVVARRYLRGVSAHRLTVGFPLLRQVAGEAGFIHFDYDKDIRNEVEG